MAAVYKSKEEFHSEFEMFMTIVRHLWQLNGEAEMKQVAKQAGVHWGTLYNWKSGETVTPRIDTLTKVARVFGYEICLKKTKKAKLVRVK